MIKGIVEIKNIGVLKKGKKVDNGGKAEYIKIGKNQFYKHSFSTYWKFVSVE